MMGREGYKEVQLIGKTVEVPKEWKVKELNGHIDILSGYSFDSSLFNNERKGVPLIRIRNLQESNIDTYYDGNYDDKYIIDNNDILIGMDGNFYVVKWNSRNALLNQRVCRVETSDNLLDQDYLYYRIQPEIKKIHRITPATTVKHLSIKDIRAIRIPVPPLPEQKKIADILSWVDKAIEKTDEIIDKTKELKKGLMQELLTKGIGHDEFKEVRMGVKSVKIPVNWKVTTMEEMAANKKYSLVDGPFGSNLTTNDYRENGEVRLVQLQNIEEFLFSNKEKKYTYKEKYEEQIRSAAKSGDIVLAKMPNPIGRACIVPDIEDKFLVVADVIKFTPSQYYDNKFAMYFFNGKQFRDQVESYATGSTRLRLNLSNFKKLDVLVPPLEEQQKIAHILSSVDDKIQKKKEQKEKLEELKKGLMQQLLTGKKRINIES